MSAPLSSQCNPALEELKLFRLRAHSRQKLSAADVTRRYSEEPFGNGDPVNIRPINHRQPRSLELQYNSRLPR